MSEFTPIETRGVLDLQDKDEVLAGYRAGLRGEPEPGSNKSRAYWHGWRNGMVDSGRAQKDDAQSELAAEIARALRAHSATVAHVEITRPANAINLIAQRGRRPGENMDKCRQDFELACGTEDMFSGRPEALEQFKMDWKLWSDAATAEREACAKIADARAMRCEEKVALAEDSDEVTHLRSLAWQFSVLAAEMRKRSNEKVSEGENGK